MTYSGIHTRTQRNTCGHHASGSLQYNTREIAKSRYKPRYKLRYTITNSTDSDNKRPRSPCTRLQTHGHDIYRELVCCEVNCGCTVIRFRHNVSQTYHKSIMGVLHDITYRVVSRWAVCVSLAVYLCAIWYHTILYDTTSTIRQNTR